ncbi:MAG: hypothetical protein HYT36_02875 [Candidatus Staskawiczbacteria bacterium]|nr:hypothetical protein [Candidatus Staskawiczbacteria bacterium]
MAIKIIADVEIIFFNCLIFSPEKFELKILIFSEITGRAKNPKNGKFLIPLYAIKAKTKARKKLGKGSVLCFINTPIKLITRIIKENLNSQKFNLDAWPNFFKKPIDWFSKTRYP